MPHVSKFFKLAKQVATKGDKRVRRQFRLGAVGIRSDGAIVTANNLPSQGPERRAHAEARLTRKLDFGSEVFVVRITRKGYLTSARPCRPCLHALRNRGIKRCYYSINEYEFGVINL